MRLTLAATALAAALTLAACGGDDDSSAPTTAAATSAATAGSAAAATTVTTAAPTTARPSTTSPATTARPTTAAPSTTADIGTIVVDADSDALRTVPVPLGTAVTLTVHSATPQEFHLHGYDLELSGTDVVFQFTADLPGTFELETHATEKVILVLQVG